MIPVELPLFSLQLKYCLCLNLENKVDFKPKKYNLKVVAAEEKYGFVKSDYAMCATQPHLF